MEERPVPPRYLRLYSLLAMAAVSGVLAALAFPPVNMGPLAWVALVPLFFALSQTRSAGQSTLCGLVHGLVFFGSYMQFLFMYGTLPWFAAALYQALFLTVFGLIAGPVMRTPSPLWRVLGGAGTWTLLAYVRSNAWGIAFSGGDLAFSQHDQLPLLQMVSVVGQLGLTYAIAAVNVALSQALLGILPFELWRPAGDPKAWAHRATGVVVVCYAVVLGAYFAGALVLKANHPEGNRSLEVALVQGNVLLHSPVSMEDVEVSQQTYLRLNQSVPASTDLTLWPESSLPGYLQSHPGLMEAASQAARQLRGKLLLGSLETLGDKFYNAALLFDSSGLIIDRYHKIDLVVYGEFVPLRDELPFLKRYPIRAHDLTPGRERKLFSIEGIRVAPLICFEGMFSRPTREVCRMGAEVLAIITSDAWAQGTIEVEQHSNTAPLRAVEARRYLCRAASTGQSAVYSPTGEPLSRIPVNGQGVLADTVYARQGLSIYHRIGDAPLILLCLIGVCVAGWFRRAAEKL